ncbi:MFS transporter, partial [Francisellaceae bacterium]|nr:MFS transporter [Francisellaceae bacterium]
MDYQTKLLEVSKFKAWFVVAIASLFFFFEFGLTSVFNTLGHSIGAEYHISMVHLGFINSLYFYTNILFLIPAGLMLDRFSTKTAIVCALFFCCVGITAISLSTSIYVLMVARLMMGLAGSFSLISGIRVATNYFRAEKLGFAIGVVIAIGMLGGYAVQEPLALVMGAYGWRHALLLVGTLGFVIMFLVAIFVRSAPKELRALRKEQCQSQKESSFWVACKAVATKSQNWYAALYIGLINVATFMLGGA